MKEKLTSKEQWELSRLKRTSFSKLSKKDFERMKQLMIRNNEWLNT